MTRPRIDCDEFRSRYGYSPEEYIVRVILGQLELRLERWEIDGIDPSEKAQGIAHDLYRQAHAREFVAGTRDFAHLLPGLGSISHDIVHSCDPDVDQIRAAVVERAPEED